MEGNTPVQNNTPVGFPTAAPSQQPTGQKKSWKWLIILILFLIVIGGVTFFVFKSSRNTTIEESPTPDSGTLSNIATPEATATPAPSPTADKSTISVQVLNGTGIAGEAGILSDALKGLGYTKVTTGNASSQNATDTQVTFSSTVPDDVKTEITSKLNSLYTSVTTGSSTLPDGTDIQVVTGLRKGQTTAPSATDTPTATETPTATP